MHLLYSLQFLPMQATTVFSLLCVHKKKFIQLGEWANLRELMIIFFLQFDLAKIEIDSEVERV